ncbi:MAG: hypothetical protein BGO12_06640 [Verrucomicrobia bacterium 61-8]|nr:hypothetical protein [Verrucomicrobiota bacterium]OJV04582.1 MAG: hypothetical protein BGO12_06640 [Verrucomicrobia bacterium 61-8]
MKRRTGGKRQPVSQRVKARRASGLAIPVNDAKPALAAPVNVGFSKTGMMTSYKAFRSGMGARLSTTNSPAGERTARQA